VDDGKKTTMRDDLDPELKAHVKRLMDSFLICLVKRAGGEVTFSVEEVDAANDLLTMDSEDGVFKLKTQARN